MSDTQEKAPRRPPVRTNPTVQFVDDIPGIVRGPHGFHPRSSKYDAVYAALKENPGRWAMIGEGDGLYGALTGYRKRRQLDDLTIANRGGKVYAGVDIPTTDGGNTQATAGEGTTDISSPVGYQAGDEATDGDGEPVESDEPETPQDAAATAVPGDDAWA